MPALSRLLRFVLPPDGSLVPGGEGWVNGYAAAPAVDGIGIFVELEVVVTGEPDVSSGYLVNIHTIDAATRDAAIPLLAAALPRPPHPARLLAGLIGQLTAPEGPLAGILDRVTWRLTPTYHVTVTRQTPNQFLLRQTFDFAAAHCLTSAAFDDDTNQATYGRCTQLHGHNYQLEVAVEIPVPEGAAAPVPGLATIENIVDRTILARFDHTELNRDTDAFAGVPPTVEHIARVCFELLTRPIAEAGGDLYETRVWETAKTSCTWGRQDG